MKNCLLGLFVFVCIACQEDAPHLSKQSTMDFTKNTPKEFATAMKRIEQPEPDRQMAAIQSWYQQIEENLQYLNEKKVNPNIQSGRQQITYYYKNDMLVKAVSETAIGDERKKDTYYWHKNKLFYCFEQTEKPHADNQKMIQQNRCYVFEDKVISYTQKEQIFEKEIDMRLAEHKDLTKTADLNALLQGAKEKEKELLEIFNKE